MAHQRLARSCQGTKLNNISEKIVKNTNSGALLNDMYLI